MDVQLALDWARGERLAELEHHLERDPWEVLGAVGARLREDAPIRDLERLEDVLKRVLRHVMVPPVHAAAALRLAKFQLQLGFLLKYKSYAVKAASPLGYAVFLQEPGLGFSFQRHVEHKTEVFHILEVLPGGYVFLCEFDEWRRAYDEAAFTRWLAGEPDPRYETYRIWPQPGDTFIIDRLNVVHTVVGCVLEEFATISTDMVDRLHDQNAGCLVPSHFERRLVERRLAALPSPSSDAVVSYGTRSGGRRPIAAVHAAGTHVTTLASHPVGARTYQVEAGQETAFEYDERHTASLFVRAGRGYLLIADEAERSRGTPQALSVTAGQLTMVPAGLHYALANDGRDELVVSEHRVPLDVAFH